MKQKFHKNDKVFVTPHDSDLFEFSGRVVGYDRKTKLYRVEDMEEHFFDFYEDELQIDTE